ncbi:MAG: TnsA-like heteromeric transposase endonuclease subunit [Actinobacteria bacterium]|nr:TnsA-like heteromeric transposase endonuclease subunit [Actinomycetota bacterium]
MTMTRPRNIQPEVELVIDGDRSSLPLSSMAASQLRACTPVRTFRWHRGQRHFPGWYWSATDRRHVMYESRLELGRLVLADFDPTVCSIRSQPFRLTFTDREGRLRRHVPDFALLTDRGGIRIVNVKPRARLLDDKVRTALEDAHAALGTAGLATEMWSGEDPVAHSTIAFLSAYRNSSLFDEAELGRARKVLRGRMCVVEAERLLLDAGITQPRPIVLHLLWTHMLRMDLTRPLEPDTVLEAA